MKLEDAIRVVLHKSTGALCARVVAERVTILDQDFGDPPTFGQCGPETEAVERALCAMPDVEEDVEGYDDEEGEVYRLKPIDRAALVAHVGFALPELTDAALVALAAYVDTLDRRPLTSEALNAAQRAREVGP